MPKQSPELKTTITAALRERRQLSDSTCRTYTSLLASLYTKLEATSMSFFVKENDAIIAHVEALESNQTKKTIFAALVVLEPDVTEYNDHMRSNMSKVHANYRLQKVDPDREAKWMSFYEVKKIHTMLMETAKLDPTLENLTNAVLSGVMSGAYGAECPPRRLLDYSEMKSANFNKKEDNYISGNTMYFNVYKTAKFEKSKNIHPQLTVPAPLRPLITRLKKAPGDYLFNNTKGGKFSASSLNKRMTSLFGFSADMLRSIFLSEVYKDTPKLDVSEALAANMSHSVGSQMYYIKK